MSDFNFRITREKSGEKQTLGTLEVLDICNETCFHCHTLELPWRNNKYRISCILTGIFVVKKRWSKKFGHHFHITDVYGRTYILIHAGNFYKDTAGCILVGESLTDIDGDGIRDVTNSRATLDKLLELMPDEFELEIL